MASTDRIFGNGTTTDGQSAAADAHYGAAKTWDFYKNTFGRLGIRGNGVGAYSRVHFGTGTRTRSGRRLLLHDLRRRRYRTFRQLVELDVAGHEMTHGVTSAHRRARLLR